MHVPDGNQVARGRAFATRAVAQAGPFVGLAVLAWLAWRWGAEPFLAALRGIDAWSLAAALALGALVTASCAWRWAVVARALGCGLTMREAVSACYRSQFVNVATPGGVLGDVLRGVGRGRATGDPGRGLRSVVWERFLGQFVQVVLAVAALALLASPVPRLLVWLPLGALAVAVAVTLGVRDRLGTEARRALSNDVLRRAAAASAAAVAGNVLTFLVAARSAGVTASPARLLPLSLVVLLAAAVPANLAGWGPREGVAAWSFGAAGLGAETGLTTAVTLGVLVVVANLPGALLLGVVAVRPRSRRPPALIPGPAADLDACRG